MMGGPSNLRKEAKVTWFQEAATEAFASLDRGEGISFDSIEELEAHIMKISEEVFARVRTGVILSP